MSAPICEVTAASSHAFSGGKVALCITQHEGKEWTLLLDAAAIPNLCAELLFAARAAHNPEEPPHV